MAKGKDDRFVTVHPKIAERLGVSGKTGAVFQTITEQRLLNRLKELCGACEFENPQQYKPHSFRRHLTSLCASHQVA